MSITKSQRLTAFVAALILAVSLTACSKKGNDKSDVSSSGTDETQGITDSTGGETGDSQSEGSTAATTGQTGGSTGSGQSSVTGTTTKNTGSNKFVKPSYNLKGREIIIWSGAGAPKSTDILYQSWKEVEQEYNCKLKFVKVSYSVAVSKMTAAALSGTSECDIWNAQWYDTFPSFVAKGMASPLSEHYKFKDDPLWANAGNENNYWNGKLYGLNTGSEGPGWGLWYNKSLLNKENLQDPATLAAQGKWNWNVFLDMLQKLTKSSGGTATQWGYYDEYLFLNLILTNGGEIIDIDYKDGPKFTMNSEATKYAMRFAVDLANKYKVVPSIGSIGDPDLLELFPKGKIAFTTYNSAYGPLCVSKGINAKDLGYTYFPKGPNAKDYIIHAPTLSPVYLVPPQAKNIDAVTCVLQDFLCVWDKSESFAVERQDLLDVAYSGSDYKTIYPNNKQFMLNGGKKNKPSYINNFFLGETLNTRLLYPLVKGEVDVDTGVKKITSSVQVKIDEMVNQTAGK